MLGGGPAGAAAALRLAQLGHRVCLVERGAPRLTPAAVSLPPSVLPVLDLLGLRSRVESAGFLRPPPALVRWHGAAASDAGPAGPAGFQVDRAHFDPLLLRAAQDTGVHVLQDVALPARDSGGRWCVPLASGAHVDAGFVIDARGRRGQPQGPATVALMAQWRPRTGSSEPDPRSRVQSGASCWAWTAPLADGGTLVAVFLDARRVAGLPQAARQALYGELLAALDLLAPCVRDKDCGPVQVCDATPRSVDDAAPQPGLLRVGEAAFSLDPLSSQGVPAALRHGWQAAACVHTAVHRPAQATLAWQFHRQQTRAVALRHQRLSARLYANAAQALVHPFWRNRASPGTPAAQAAAWPGLDDSITLDSLARCSEMPVLEGGWIVARQAIQHPLLDAPIAFLAGQPASDWLCALQDAPRLRDLLDDWHTRFGATRTQAVWPLLWQQGLLRAGA